VFNQLCAAVITNTIIYLDYLLDQNYSLYLHMIERWN